MKSKHLRLVLVALTAYLPFGSFSQPTNSTLHNGKWSDPAVWSKGVAPVATDYVRIDHYVHLDQNAVMTAPGTVFISATGELCGDYYFEGSFTNYGPFKVREVLFTDSSYSYGQVLIANSATVVIGGSWHVEPPGDACVGCPFTCAVQAPTADFGSSVTVCERESVQFNDMSVDFPTSWSWSFSGGTPSISSQQNPVIIYNQVGVYDVTLIASNPLGSDTIVKFAHITVVPSPTVTVSPEITIHYGDTVILNASGGGTCLWNTGDTNFSISVHPSETTTYNVIVTSSNGCTDIDYVTVNIEPCPPLYIPNAFSPNGDGENEFLQLYNTNWNCQQEITFEVFNRSGERVFVSSDKGFQWDGMFQGQPLNPGVFTYRLSVRMFDDEMITRKGNITLVR